MQLRGIFAALPIIATAFAASGADLSFFLQGDVAYDANVFRVDRDEEDDVLLRLRPGVRVHEDRDTDLNYAVSYELPVEFAIENNDELRDVDHVARGNIEYRVNDKLTFFASDDLRFLRSTLGPEQTGPDFIGDNVAIATRQNERDRVRINDGTIGMSYRVTPRIALRLTGDTQYFDTTRDDRSDNLTGTGTFDVNYALSPRHQIGAGVRYTYQDFEDREDLAGSTSQIYGAFATWRWLVTNTLRFDLQGGPSYIDTDQDDARLFRNRNVVPSIRVLNGSETVVAVASDGATVARRGPGQGPPVAAGSLLVPILCGSVDMIRVAAGCSPGTSSISGNNVYLDAVTDAGDVAAVLSNFTPVRNLNPQGEDDTGLDFFVNATITQQWSPTLDTAFRYTRRQGNASGLGGTVIADIFNVVTTWDITDRWQLSLRGDWTQRESNSDAAQTFDQVFLTTLPSGAGAVIASRCASGVLTAAGCAPAANTPGGLAFNTTRSSEIDTRRWGVAGRVTHRLFRNTLVFVQVRYDDQDSSRESLGAGSDFENYIASFGVRHTFEPLQLW